MSGCARCGQPAVRVVDDEGGHESGPFWEDYECQHCGSTGTIRGDASDPPHEWTRTGGVF
jgi:DNA-directed RNA polymerase subunit RPC12/RpoP